MSVTFKSMILAVVLIIAAAMLYRYSGITGQLSNEEISERYPSFEASKLSGDYFDKQGQLNYSFKTDNISYYKNKDAINTTAIEAKYFHIKDNQVAQEWVVRANSSLIVLNKFAVLEGNILVRPNFADSIIKEISTPQVYFDMVTNVLKSKESISIRGEQFTNQGANYFVDLNHKTFVIKDKPHAVYYPKASAMPISESK